MGITPADRYELDTGSDDPINMVELQRPFYLEVDPIDADLDGWLLLTQTFGPFSEGSGFPLAMSSAVRFDGTLSGQRATPWLMTGIPTETVEVTGKVVLDRAEGGRQYIVSTDDSGNFSLDVVPDTYHVTILPDDPRVPITTELQFLLTDTSLDLEIGPGVSIWGQVTNADGVGIENVPVFAIDEAGYEGAPTTTTTDGWYELRVSSGTYSVGLETRGREPLVVSRGVEVGEQGARIDLGYADTQQVEIEGRILDASDAVVADMVVRLTSRSLVGYAPDEASYQVDLVTNSRGFFVDRIPAGVYDIEVLPTRDDDVSPLVVTSRTLVDDLNLGDFVLPAMRDVWSTVESPTGTPLPFSPVLCTELGGSGRSWNATSDEFGSWFMRVSSFDLVCSASPPPDQPDLAFTRILVNADTFPASFALQAGTSVGGKVAVRNLPDEGDASAEVPVSAIVRVIDLDGVHRGTTQTNPQGEFDLPVVWAP